MAWRNWRTQPGRVVEFFSSQTVGKQQGKFSIGPSASNTNIVMAFPSRSASQGCVLQNYPKPAAGGETLID